MGILDRLREIFAEEKETEQVELGFSDIETFLASRSDRIKRIEQQAAQFKQKLQERFRSIQVLVEQLKHAKPTLSRSWPEKAFTAGQAIRDKFCEDAERAISRLPSGVQDFFTQSQSAFTILNLDARKAEILMIVFEPELKQYSRALVELKKNIDAFSKFVRRDLVLIKKYDELKLILARANDYKADIKKTKKELAKVKKDIDFLQAKRQNIAEQIRKLQNFKKSTEVAELDKEVAELEAKNKMICAELDSKLSELKKPLKKFKYLVGQGVYSANQRLINEYLKNPSQTLFADNRLGILDILTELKKALSKEIELEQKQLEKVLNIIDTLSTDYLNELRKKYGINEGLLQQCYAQRTQLLTPAVFKQRALEREVNMLDGHIEQTAQELAKQKKIKAKLEAGLKGTFEQIELLTKEVTGAQVKIVD